jgi:uncharacterized protein YjiS (DUF1127 family)
MHEESALAVMAAMTCRPPFLPSGSLDLSLMEMPMLRTVRSVAIVLPRGTAMTSLASSLAMRKTLERLLCHWRSAKQARQARAVIAEMTARELRDIGLSHADALPAMRACCE